MRVTGCEMRDWELGIGVLALCPWPHGYRSHTTYTSYGVNDRMSRFVIIRRSYTPVITLTQRRFG
jgi:hypothetical protein